MSSSVLLAWRQLSHHKVKMVVASAGVVVAVMLMLVQLGIRQGAMDNGVAVTRRITSDLIVVSPRTRTIFQSNQFPRRLLFRLPAHPSVDRVEEVYMGQARFRNLWDHREYPISVTGLDPRSSLMNLQGYSKYQTQLELPDRAIFDGLSRDSFGPVAKHLREVGPLETEVNFRKVTLQAVIEVGISFSSDGNLYTTPVNFLRMFPARRAGSIDLGLVSVKPGTDLQKLKRELQPYLGAEATVLTKEELVAAEIRFLREAHPLDFIFGMGAAVGFFIGFVVVYQILYSDVTNHLPQFATMKAMGFTDNYLLRVVLSQAMILTVMGYIPGFFMAIGLYEVATKAIQMKFSMTIDRALGVFAATVIMCGFSAMIAIQKARTADPADVF